MSQYPPPRWFSAWLATGVAIILLFGCDNVADTAVEPEAPPGLTAEQSNTRARLQETALALVSVASEAEAVVEVKRGVDQRVGHDENVLFGELLGLASSASKVQEGTAFSATFEKALQTSAKKSGLDNLKAYLLENKAVIYWPYASQWDGKTPPTITFHPMDDVTESNVGYRPIAGVGKESGVAQYEEVTVDDDYAMANPTWIVSPLSKLELDDLDYGTNVTPSCEETNSCDGGGSGGGGSAGPYDRVLIGYVRCIRKYDTVFNGGSDLRFLRGGPVMQGTNPRLEWPRLSVNFSRDEINKQRSDKNRWKQSSGIWDPNWTSAKLEEQFAIFEEDTYLTKKLSANLAYKPSTTTTVTVTGEVTIQNNAYIYNNEFDRNSFFGLNRTSHGRGLKAGYAIYSVGSDDVLWTMPEIHQP